MVSLDFSLIECSVGGRSPKALKDLPDLKKLPSLPLRKLLPYNTRVLMATNEEMRKKCFVTLELTPKPQFQSRAAAVFLPSTQNF